MEDDLHKKTHAATLEYLTKPSYQSSIFATQHKTTNAAMSVSKEDKRFYKKRILSATKEMFYKTSYPKTLQIIHEEYLANIIEYLKVCDMEDIIQREYDDVELTSSINKIDINNNIQLSDINKSLYNEQPNKNPMDQFVTTKKINVKPDHIPKQKKIDLKRDEFKTKGIKKKKNILL